MADVAIGKTCANCGTLVACAGSFSDTTLVGECPVCKTAVTASHVAVQNGAFVNMGTQAEEAQAVSVEAPAPAETSVEQTPAEPVEPKAPAAVEPATEPEAPVDNPVLPESTDAPAE